MMSTVEAAVARWYLRLLALRHLSIVAGLLGLLLLVSGAPDAVRVVGGVGLVSGIVGFAFSVTVLLIPPARILLRDRRVSSTQLLATINLLTGHTLIEEAMAAIGASRPARPTMKLIVGIEVALCIAVPFAAALGG